MKRAPHQEHIIEEVAAYTIQAGEILINELNEIEPKYRRLFLPKWPELYTGPLKAAWYLLLDFSVKHVILVTNQMKHPDNITLFTDKEGIIALGKTVSVKEIDFNNIKEVKEIDEEILFQCNFLRILKNITSISIVWIGENVKREVVIKEINNIIKSSEEIWIIFYDTCSTNIEQSISRSVDEKALKNIINKKVEDSKSNIRLANIFVKTLSSKTKPHLLGYVNTWDFDPMQKKITSYVCLVG